MGILKSLASKNWIIDLPSYNYMEEAGLKQSPARFFRTGRLDENKKN